MVMDVLSTLLQHQQHQSWQAAATRFRQQSNGLSQQLHLQLQQPLLTMAAAAAGPVNCHCKVSSSSSSSSSHSVTEWHAIADIFSVSRDVTVVNSCAGSQQMVTITVMLRQQVVWREHWLMGGCCSEAAQLVFCHAYQT
jgi:hypothetical protein